MGKDDPRSVLDTNLTGAYRVAKRAVRGVGPGPRRAP